MRPPIAVLALIVGSAACAAPAAGPRSLPPVARVDSRSPDAGPSPSRPVISAGDARKIANARLQAWELHDKGDEELLTIARLACDLASWSGPAGRLDDLQVAVGAATSLKFADALEQAFCPEVVKERRAELEPPAPPRPRPPRLTAHNRIRGVDLRNAIYPAGTCRAPNWRSTFPVAVIDGHGESGSREDGTFTGMEVSSDPQYADIDGDGIEDAVQEVACNGGGLHVENYFVPLTLRGGRLEILGGHSIHAVANEDLPLLDARVDGGALKGRTLEVVERVPADEDEPRCCYSGRASVRWWWNGRTFVRDRARRLPRLTSP